MARKLNDTTSDRVPMLLIARLPRFLVCPAELFFIFQFGSFQAFQETLSVTQLSPHTSHQSLAVTSQIFKGCVAEALRVEHA